jgi:hypothetical protein
MCINGVSSIVASKIENKYKNIDALINELKSNKDCLLGLEINNNRKIGKALAKTIHDSFL